MIETTERKSRLIAFLLLILFAVGGCAGSGQQGIELPKTPERIYIPGETPPPPEYKIGLGDILEVKFFYAPELNETLLVRSDGRITLPRLGDYVVVGLSPSQLDSIVTAKYSEILKDPDITVQVRESAEEVVYVLGEVDNPGPVPMRGRLSVLQAVAARGGFSNVAKSSSVIVFRSDGLHAPTAQKVDLSKTLKHSALEENIWLAGYDIIYVPKTFIGKVDLFMNQFFTSVFPPLLDTYMSGYDAFRIKERYDYYNRARLVQ